MDDLGGKPHYFLETPKINVFGVGAIFVTKFGPNPRAWLRHDSKHRKTVSPFGPTPKDQNLSSPRCLEGYENLHDVHVLDFSR